VEAVAERVVDFDAEDFGAPVALAVIDVGNALDDFGFVLLLFGMRGGFVAAVAIGHGGGVGGDDGIRIAHGSDLAAIEPEDALTDGFDFGDGVGDEDDGDAARTKLLDPAHALPAELGVANGKRFVHDENFGIGMDGAGKRETDEHAARIGTDGMIDKGADFGESFDIGGAFCDLARGEAEDGAVEARIFPAGEFRIEAGAKFEESRHPALYAHFAGAWLEDARHELERSALAGAVFADDAEDLAATDFEADVAQGFKIAVKSSTVEGCEFLQAIGGRVVNGVALRDMLEFDGSQPYSLIAHKERALMADFEQGSRVAKWLENSQNMDMTVSVTEAKNKLTQLLAAVEKGERVTIERHGRAVAEIVKPAGKRKPKFGTLKDVLKMTPKQFHELTRPMTDEEVDAFLEGRY
jgi:antitoxin (DNA-binding transcriptional repressor) of toxin-antitoxin stability system